MQTAKFQPTKALTYKQALKINPELSLGGYGIHLLHIESEAGVYDEVRKEMDARASDPLNRLELLDFMMGGVESLAEEMVNHSNPHIRAKAAKQVRDFIVRMWEIAEFDSI
jgi:hypothetical protein